MFNIFNYYYFKIQIILKICESKKTTHRKGCPNAMYKNRSYGYTNYGSKMGTIIDAGDTSVKLFLQS